MLEPGAYGIHEPLAHWPEVPARTVCWCRCWPLTPRVIGWAMAAAFMTARLALLNGARAIGIAYAGQEVASLPRERP